MYNAPNVAEQDVIAACKRRKSFDNSQDLSSAGYGSKKLKWLAEKEFPVSPSARRAIRELLRSASSALNCDRLDSAA